MIRLKKLLIETEWGFDLTQFKPSGFQKVLSGLGIQVSPGKMGGEGWTWKGKGITIVTGNDPITGKYRDEGGRHDEKDYASYMGLEGTPDMIKTAVSLIKKNAVYIKDESKNSRDFI